MSNKKYQYVIDVNNIAENIGCIEDLSGYENAIVKEADDLEIATTPALKNAESLLEDIYSDVSITKKELEHYSLSNLEDVDEYLSLLSQKMEAIFDHNEKCERINNSKLDSYDFIKFSMKIFPSKIIKPEDLF